MKMNIRGLPLLRVSKKTLYVMSLLALVAAATISYLLLPTFNSSSTALAQGGVKQEEVTTEMLSRALDFRTATSFAVLAEKSITDNGFSKVGGDVGVTSEAAEIKGLNRNNVKGMLRSGGGEDKTKKNFSDSFSAINQLPCTEVADTNLGGRTFTPGVFCLSSADLAGQLILNADNNANGVFIFRLAGSLTAQSGSDMLLMNEAKAHNVFFLANDSATVGEGSNFRGSILAKNNINVRSGSIITGRTLSLNGSVELENATVALQTGFLEICKTANGFIDANSNQPGSGGLDGRVFTITVGGQTVQVPVGGCSRPIELASGMQTIQEDIRNTNLAGGEVRDGRFILTSAAVTRGPGTLGAVNLPARTAVVNIPPSATPGTLNNETVVTLNNQFAVVGFVEICKEADDSGVTGFFTFTIDGVTSGFGQPAPLAQFIVPVGQCTGAIAVSTPTAGASSDSAVTNGFNETSVNNPTATAPSLGTAARFAVLAGSTVTNSGSSVVTGNLGVSPGTVITGFPPGIVVGTINAGDAVAAQAQSDVTTAFNNITGQACDVDLTGMDLGGKTLVPGTYCFSSSAQLTGTLTLDAQGNPNAVFIFKTGSTLTTASNSRVVVINGGTGCNVFFQVNTSATLGTGTQFTGNILALTSITLTTGANINAGRALARNGAVTLDTNNIDSSQCVNVTPTPTPITPTPTPVTPTPTPEMTPTPTPTPTSTPTPTPGMTPTPTPTVTPTPQLPPTVIVRELPSSGFTFTGAFTLPAGRLINVDVVNRAVTARVVEGGVSSQTTIFFRNRSEAVLKVCKIAGPGVPVGTLFTFNVTGSNTAAPSGTGGTTTEGAIVTSQVTVPAGPVPGGFCVFVPGDARTTPPVTQNAAGQRTFTTGSRITVTELGTTTDQENPINIGGITGNVQVSRIRFLNDLTGATNGTGANSTGINNNARTIMFNALPGVNEVEFVNFIFNPGLLKVCKVAADDATLGQVFTFDVTTGTDSDLLPDTTRTFTVQAGPRATGDVAQNGFCTFVDGPFTNTGTTGAGGFFNLGSNVTVTERALTGFRLVSITSPTAGTTGFSTTGSSGTLSGSNGVIAGTSEIVFTNAGTGAVTAASVSVSGRILSSRSRGVSNAVVHLTNQNGEIQTARTNRFGYYTFRELAAGETYIFSVFAKRYQFNTQVITLTEDLAELDFTAQ